MVSSSIDESSVFVYVVLNFCILSKMNNFHYLLVSYFWELIYLVLFPRPYNVFGHNVCLPIVFWISEINILHYSIYIMKYPRSSCLRTHKRSSVMDKPVLTNQQTYVHQLFSNTECGLEDLIEVMYDVEW